MRSVEDLLGEVDALQALSPEHRSTIAGCGRLEVFERGDSLLREGDRADVFYVIRTGAVALETYVPRRGAVTLQTLHDHDLLGWSWLVPPYRVAFDARAIEETRVIAFDARHLARVPAGIGVAAGEGKVRPILGALRAGVVRTLVTDVATAEAVVALNEAAPPAPRARKR